MRTCNTLNTFLVQHGIQHTARAAVAVENINLVVARLGSANFLSHARRNQRGAVVENRRQTRNMQVFQALLLANRKDLVRERTTSNEQHLERFLRRHLRLR